MPLSPDAKIERTGERALIVGFGALLALAGGLALFATPAILMLLLPFAGAGLLTLWSDGWRMTAVRIGQRLQGPKTAPDTDAAADFLRGWALERGFLSLQSPSVDVYLAQSTDDVTPRLFVWAPSAPHSLPIPQPLTPQEHAGLVHAFSQGQGLLVLTTSHRHHHFALSHDTSSHHAFLRAFLPAKTAMAAVSTHTDLAPTWLRRTVRRLFAGHTPPSFFAALERSQIEMAISQKTLTKGLQNFQDQMAHIRTLINAAQPSPPPKTTP